MVKNFPCERSLKKLIVGVGHGIGKRFLAFVKYFLITWQSSFLLLPTFIGVREAFCSCEGAIKAQHEVLQMPRHDFDVIFLLLFLLQGINVDNNFQGDSVEGGRSVFCKKNVCMCLSAKNSALLRGDILKYDYSHVKVSISFTPTRNDGINS